MQRKLNLFASQRLIELFSNINHQIAQTFSESIRYRHSYPVSYLDFGSTNDTISFITRNKYDDIHKTNQADWQSRVWKEKRSEMKIGKLIKMFYQDHFPPTHKKGEPRPKPEIDIESFVNKFKAERDKDVNYDRFEIIDGKDFHHWYTQDNYSRFVHEETTLGRSCLRYNESSKFLHMYSKNPGTFRMLILKDDAGKLRGRANLWKLDEPKDRIYMDRIYYVNDFDVELFKDYAKREGWLHKELQTYGWHNNIVDTRNGEIYKWDQLIMKASIKVAPGGRYKYYPYIDTLSVYNPEEKTLTNDGRLRVLNPHLILTDYQGSYHSEVDGHERVFSSAYNEYIRRDEAVFVEIDDTWVYESDAVYVHNSGGKHAFRNSDKVVESYIYKRKWFLKECAEYSEYLGTYVHKDSVRIAFIDTDKKEEVKIHYRMIGKEFVEKDGVIVKKKINPKQRRSSKPSLKDKDIYNIERILRGMSGDPSSPRRRRLDDNWSDIFYNPYEREQRENEPLEERSVEDVDSNTEEDSDIFSEDMSNYRDEVRRYIEEELESRRTRRVNRERNVRDEEERIRNEFRFHPPNQIIREVRQEDVVEDRPDEPTERVSYDVETGRDHITWRTVIEPTEETVREDEVTDEVEPRTDSDGDDGTTSQGDGGNYRAVNRESLDDVLGNMMGTWTSTDWGTTTANIRDMYINNYGIPLSLFGGDEETDNQEDTPDDEDIG